MTVGVLVSPAPVGQPGQLPFLLGLRFHSVAWDGRTEGYLRVPQVCRSLQAVFDGWFHSHPGQIDLKISFSKQGVLKEEISINDSF